MTLRVLPSVIGQHTQPLTTFFIKFDLVISILQINNFLDLIQLLINILYIFFAICMIQASRVCGLVAQWVPDTLLSDKPASKWANLIVEEHKNSEHVRGRWEPQKVKDNVVAHARFHWALLFSRFFAIMPIGTDSEALMGAKQEEQYSTEKPIRTYQIQCPRLVFPVLVSSIIDLNTLNTINNTGFIVPVYII